MARFAPADRGTGGDVGYRGPSIFTIIYVAVGVIVASDHHYFSSLDTAKLVAEMVLAVILWPLLLFGVDFRF